MQLRPRQLGKGIVVNLVVIELDLRHWYPCHRQSRNVWAYGGGDLFEDARPCLVQRCLHGSREIGGKPSSGFRGHPHGETLTELVQIHTGEEAPPALAKIAAGDLRL